jgi:hypothetical protein
VKVRLDGQVLDGMVEEEGGRLFLAVQMAPKKIWRRRALHTMEQFLVDAAPMPLAGEPR